LKPPEDAKIVCEEVFGPVANVNVFYTEKEVVEKINSVEFGPYAVMFTINID
jgi:acyl-CoA reductase-like NAD-dependent aldehyde dehydrogenase